MNKMVFIKIFVCLVIIGIILLLWARFISTKGLVIKEYGINISKLDEHYDGFKIMHFTDIHYGTTINVKEIKKIVETINKQEADVVLFTGDMFDENVTLSDDNLNVLFEELNKVEANIGIYYVPGNHDYLVPQYLNKFKENINWKNLTNTYEYIYKESNIPILLVGLDDYWYGEPNYKEAFSYYNETTKDYYTIVVMHEPDQVDKLDEYNYDIAIAGHSHLGQVRFPFIGSLWTPYGSKKYYEEHYNLDNNKELYISGGLGTSGLKLRFLNKPSMNMYRFYTK